MDCSSPFDVISNEGIKKLPCRIDKGVFVEQGTGIEPAQSAWGYIDILPSELLVAAGQLGEIVA